MDHREYGMTKLTNNIKPKNKVKIANITKLLSDLTKINKKHSILKN